MYDVKRIRLVKLLEILRQNTDELNHMTTSTIIKKLAESGIESTRQTVYNDVKFLNQYGYNIVCVRHTVNEYYIEDDSFELPEMQILLDAVQAAKFITPKKTEELVNKIIAMGGSYKGEVEKNNIVYFNTVKHTNEAIYYNINEIIHAILEQKKVTFNYFDFNEKKEKVYRKNKKTYKENPCALIFSDDNYYLVAYSDKYKGIAHYRIDRMDNVQVSKEEIFVPDDFDIQKHKSELFGMFTGETKTVLFETDKSMIDVILDQFGEDIEFISTDDGKLRFKADVQVSPKFISWVCSFGNRLKVLGPITFKKLSDKWLERAERNYSVTYLGNAESALKAILPLIGGYRVNEINPSIVQSVYDKIDEMKKKTYEIYPKRNIKKILERQSITFVWLRSETELNRASLSRVYNGLSVGIKFATMFAKVCEMDIDRLFDITVHSEPYSESTRRSYKLAIYNVLAYAVRLRIIDDNYASAEFVDSGKRKKKNIRCMDEEELAKFYDALCKVTNIQWRVAVKTTLLTGMRRGEVCGLNWDDIDFENSRIRIQRSYTEVQHYKDKKGYFVLKGPKTPSSNRVIAIPDILVAELKEYKKWYDEQAELWGDRWVDSGSVFIQRNGQRINPVNLKMWVTKTCTLAGIAHYSVHSLRHTNITLQIMAGIPIVTVSGRAGHSKTSTTTDVYAYYINSSDKSAAKALDGIFSNLGDSKCTQ